MNLKPAVVEALKDITFTTATEVQERTIPAALEGRDLIVRAKTGTGKTCAFLVPIMQRNIEGRHPEALIIVPTRELALQIYEVVTKLRRGRRESVVVVYGGASINVQIQNLKRSPDLVIGTPGRILDLFKRGNLRLDGIKFLVLDEADTMFDMGFIDNIELILSKTPNSRQTLLFSATMPQRIINIAKRHMHSPMHISVGKEEEPIVTKISHYFAVCEYSMKFATLLAYIKEYNPKKGIIFVQTQRAASMVHDTLVEQGVDVMLIHGGLSQARRESSMREFRNRTRFLIATNIAARGIDVAGISDIINFDAPDDPNVYVHRVGRSARMDADGRAFTIVSYEQRSLIQNIEYATNIHIDPIDLNTAPFASIRAFKRPRSAFNRSYRGNPRSQRGVQGVRGQRRPYGYESRRSSYRSGQGQRREGSH